MCDCVDEDGGSAGVGVRTGGCKVVETVVFCPGGGVREKVSCWVVVVENLEGGGG